MAESRSTNLFLGQDQERMLLPACVNADCFRDPAEESPSAATRRTPETVNVISCAPPCHAHICTWSCSRHTWLSVRGPQAPAAAQPAAREDGG